MSTYSATTVSATTAPATGAATDEAEQLRAELRAVARDLLASGAAPSAGTPSAGERKDDGEADWAQLAEAGWLGLEVPEQLDGAGVTFAETAVVCQELGRAAVRAPYLGTAVLGAGVLLAAEPCAGRDELLGALASGAPRLAVALPTGDAALGARAAAVSFRLAGGAGGATTLDGRADFVPDAAGADTLLVPALDEAGAPVVVRLDPAQPGLEVTETPVLDVSRGVGSVAAAGAVVDPGAVWPLVGDGWSALRLLHARAALAVACDALGVAEAMMETTVAYVGVRQQFGRPIGSFQAVKHGCADMFIQVSVGRGLVADAVRALASVGQDVGGATAPDLAEDLAAVETAVSRAKSYVGAAAVDVAGKAMQLHGGIGYTWESGVHRYLKRAALSRSLFGSPAAHRARLARRFD
ncbi:acyl-CoA/acyl-ACP dehydrogenase [Frankia sp. CNm7]|uniref:Acyl-CoA/acyl-ACP dehydrogenase n=1 Tax=Frankia nepalensis TaxID=1836974 RepID=A0A937UM28_9ACTN|nr:acyl-CoA dehydrogenase family protein [Frankia nepalensis]MBL7496802.1 acyl-CoA/acyl-ACP dehydrogenase [Frankia nepalensis]MBL7523721.1 acyl-CoA/acyl-ACP dehydrogenase [Frankia nepalensis]MBL7626638.1 acyl-CoA/acyl-ACP dehydrogenase [Frankia nepalensis]